jgi:hypothetical protein
LRTGGAVPTAELTATPGADQYLARFGPTTPKQVPAKQRSAPYSAGQVPAEADQVMLSSEPVTSDPKRYSLAPFSIIVPHYMRVTNYPRTTRPRVGTNETDTLVNAPRKSQNSRNCSLGPIIANSDVPDKSSSGLDLGARPCKI